MDEKAYEQIAHRARPEIESIVRRFFASLQIEEEIDDVVQEVLILLWRYRDRLDKVEKLEAWVNRVSRNQCATGSSNGKRMCPLTAVISLPPTVLRALLMTQNGSR